MIRTLCLALMTSAAVLMAAPLFAADEKKPDDAASAADAAKRHGELFDKLDANHDGFISGDEVPADRKRLFDRLVRRSDKTSDSKLSRDEFIAGMAEDRTKDRPFSGLLERPDGDGPPPGDRPGPDGKGGPPPEGGPPRMTMGPLFHTLDTNHDGKLDETEIAGATESLKKIAKNGEITRDDLMESARQAYGAGGPGGLGIGRPDFNPDEAAKHMLHRLDKNGDSKVQKEELPQRRQKDFDALDTNHDGVLDEEELKAAIPQMTERANEARTAKTEKRHKSSGDEMKRDEAKPEGAKPEDKGSEK